MLTPFTPAMIELQIRSLTQKNETITVELVSGSNIVSSIVYVPNCE